MSTPIVQVKIIGRLGNQLHQYCAMRKYAQQVGAQLEVQDWIGRHIFQDITEPEWSRELPEISDGSGAGQVIEHGQVNVRVGGYFQMQRWVGVMSRVEIKRWLRIKPELLEAIGPKLKPWYAAAHIRQGDYLGHPLFANVLEPSYLRACEEHQIPEDQMIWVRENQSAAVPGLPDFLPDFVTLMRADVLLRANSSFSWWAATLGDGQVFAPVVENNVGCYDASFVRGNWPRIADTRTVGTVVEDLHLPE